MQRLASSWRGCATSRLFLARPRSVLSPARGCRCRRAAQGLARASRGCSRRIASPKHLFSANEPIFHFCAATRCAHHRPWTPALSIVTPFSALTAVPVYPPRRFGPRPHETLPQPRRSNKIGTMQVTAQESQGTLTRVPYAKGPRLPGKSGVLACPMRIRDAIYSAQRNPIVLKPWLGSKLLRVVVRTRSFPSNQEPPRSTLYCSP